MNFLEAREYIRGLIRRGIKYELSKMERLSELLGKPERSIPWIHITGTNGKGSTAATLAAFLRGCGLSVGLFTSPHLVSICERFRVNGEDASAEEFAKMVDSLRPAIETMEKEEMGAPTFFEICTAGACLHFLEKKVDIAIAEVGLGGALDATNVIQPLLTIISNVSWDHPKTLGGTYENICRQKCGIIKEGVPLLCGVTQGNLRKIVEDTCASKKANLHYLQDELALSHIRMNSGTGTSFELEFTNEEGRHELTTPLLGPHQALNAAMAIAAARLLPNELFREKGDGCFPRDDETWNRALSLTRWEGRFQIFSRNPTVVMDGGHNVEGVKTLVETWQSLFPNRKAIVVSGFSGDKLLGDILALLRPICSKLILTKSENYRAADPHRLYHVASEVDKNIPKLLVEQPGAAFDEARRLAKADGHVLVTGSLYLIGSILAYERGLDGRGL